MYPLSIVPFFVRLTVNPPFEITPVCAWSASPVIVPDVAVPVFEYAKTSIGATGPEIASPTGATDGHVCTVGGDA